MSQANTQTNTGEPTFRAPAFCCPHCRSYAHHSWFPAHRSLSASHYADVKGLWGANCDSCTRYSLWVDEVLVYPVRSTAPPPAADMPDDVRADFLEARDVFDRSPRSAAALLRLALQRLLKHLGEPGESIDDAVASLVRKGLPPRIQQGLAAVRMTGSNAVQPGQLVLGDSKDLAGALFHYLNLIVEQMITQPKKLEAIYASLPPSSRGAIMKLDQ